MKLKCDIINIEKKNNIRLEKKSKCSIMIMSVITVYECLNGKMDILSN